MSDTVGYVNPSERSVAASVTDTMMTDSDLQDQNELEHAINSILQDISALDKEIEQSQAVSRRIGQHTDKMLDELEAALVG